MTDFPVRGQSAPNFWNEQLQMYIDERDAANAQALADTLTGPLKSVMKGVLRPLYEANAPLNNLTDLNDAKAQYAGAWYINNSYTNDPVGFTSGLLEILTFENGAVTQHRLTDAETGAIYMRRFWTGDSTWTAWKTLSTALLGTAVQPAGLTAAITAVFTGTDLGTADLDTITTPGVYRNATLASVTLARNYPVANVIAIVRVYGSGSFVQQEFVRPDHSTQGSRGTWTRLRAGGVWSTWRFQPTQRINNPAGQPGVEAFTWDADAGVERQLRVTETVLGTVDLDLVTLSGNYRQDNPANATLALHYPQAAITCTLEVYRVNSTNLTQHLTIVGGAGAVWPLVYVRRMSSGTWGGWRLITSNSLDLVAGLRVRIWDDFTKREQLTYADTGWRDISGTVTWDDTRTDAAKTRTAYIRRQNYSVSVIATFSLPAGFPTAYGSIFVAGAGLTAFRPTFTTPVKEFHTTGNRPSAGVSAVEVSANMAAAYITGWTTGGAYTFAADYPTMEGWPAALPGTAFGSIPNA